MMLKTQELPEGIEGGCGQKWFAADTKPLQEQIALLNLERQSFECCLPIVENPYRRRSVHNQARHEPLFPRYLLTGQLKAADRGLFYAAPDVLQGGSVPVSGQNL